MMFLKFLCWLLEQVLSFVVIVVPLLIAVAFFTLAERKIMAAMQRRSGPHIVGYWGLLQPFADGVKLLTKQTIVPNKAQRTLFMFAPVYTFALALSAWVVIPYDVDAVIADISLGVVYLLAISTLSVYGIIIAGWASNSKYAFLGALRAAAQMISYDVSLGLILLSIGVCVGSFNLTEIVLAQEYRWFIVPFFPLAIMFFISSLAETNRAPFDLTEAEAELVAGYNVEYSAVGFVLFFLAEYANMLLMSLYFVILFLGGWSAPFAFLSCISPKIWLAIKTVLIVFLFVWVRASLPRFRYDQLMTLGWKVFLPWALVFFVLVSSFFLLVVSFETINKGGALTVDDIVDNNITLQSGILLLAITSGTSNSIGKGRRKFSGKIFRKVFNQMFGQSNHPKKEQEQQININSGSVSEVFSIDGKTVWDNMQARKKEAEVAKFENVDWQPIEKNVEAQKAAPSFILPNGEKFRFELLVPSEPTAYQKALDKFYLEAALKQAQSPEFLTKKSEVALPASSVVNNNKDKKTKEEVFEQGNISDSKEVDDSSSAGSSNIDPEIVADACYRDDAFLHVP